MPGPKSEVESIGEEAEEYLGFKSISTAEIYRTAFRKFIISYRKRHGSGTGFDHFLGRIYQNLQLPIHEQKRVAEGELVEFIDDLIEGGTSNNTIRLYFSAVQNFLKYKRIPVSAKWIGNFPKSIPKKKNHKHEWKLEQINEFVDKATTYRDKTIILTLFQSGMSVNELINLNYGDVETELNEEILPLMLNMVRQKTGIQYRTFLGADAIKYLRGYLETRRNLNHDSPLFTKQGTDNARITVGLIQAKFREIAKELSFIKKNGGYNPARPHSLRSAFFSRLQNFMDKDLIEYQMGHSLPATKQAYNNMPSDELRELYAQFEHRLSIENTSKNVLTNKTADIIKIDEETRARIEGLERLVGDLVEKLGSLDGLKERIEELEDYVDIGALRKEAERLPSS